MMTTRNTGHHYSRNTNHLQQVQSVRSFFEKIRAAEQAPVVLARK